MFGDSSLFRIDALVVGAGPTGLIAALELARYGLRVRIIDKSSKRPTTSRAAVVWPRTLEHLDRLGLTSHFLSKGLKLTMRKIYQGEDFITDMNFESADTPFPYGLMIPQGDTELILEERLAEYGVMVERNRELIQIHQDDWGISATVRRLNEGYEEVIHGQWLVGADGAHSTTRKLLEIPFEGQTLYSVDWRLADVKFEGWSLPSELRFHFHKKGALGLFPYSDSYSRVVYNMPYADGTVNEKQPPAVPTVEELLNVMQERGGYNLRVADVKWMSGFRVNERHAKQFRVGRVPLIGDAAHVHSPAGGQGMNIGMQDAFNLSWKLAMISNLKLSDSAGLRLLASYEMERMPTAISTIKTSGRYIRAASVENPVLQWMRDKALQYCAKSQTFRRKMTDELFELSTSYARSPLNGYGCGVKNFPAPGERYPVTEKDREPVSTGSEPLFTVFTNPPFFENAKTLVAAYPRLLSERIRESAFPNSFFLVRPDGYVAYCSTGRQWARAYVYFKSTF